MADTVVAAIWALHAEVRWKEGKDVKRLAKCKKQGHLPQDATLDDYAELIQETLVAPDSRVYRYHDGGAVYGAVVGEREGRDWFFLFTLDGVMEKAFPPAGILKYIARRDMYLLGTAEVLLS